MNTATNSREQNNNFVNSNGRSQAHLQTSRPAQQAQIKVQQSNSNVTTIEIMSNPHVYYFKSPAISSNIFEGKSSERNVVIKIGDKMKIDREVSHLLALEHPNIVQYMFKCCDANGKSHLITEHYKHPLRDHLKLQVPIKDIMSQLMSAVAFLQEKNIVHLDIAPDNVFLIKNDFGIAVKLTNFEYALKMQALVVRVDSFNYKSSQSGSFTPPEVFAQKWASKSSDIWSLGRILTYLMTEKGYMKKVQRNGKKFDEPYSVDIINMIKNDSNNNHLCKDLLSKLLVIDWKLRINAKEALKHPFFWSAQETLYFIVEIAIMIEDSRKHGGNFHNEIFEKSGRVIGGRKGADWTKRVGSNLLGEIQKSREAFGKNKKIGKVEEVDGTKIMSLINTVRNMKVHARSAEVTAIVGSDDETFLNYWTSKFPFLIVHLYEVKCKSENMEN